MPRAAPDVLSETDAPEVIRLVTLGHSFLSSDRCRVTCGVLRHGTTTVVTPCGEIDLATVGELREALRDAFAGRPETLLVDLAGVAFTDSAGVHALLDAHARALAAGVRLVLLPAAEPVHRAFLVTGTESLLPFARRADE